MSTSSRRARKIWQAPHRRPSQRGQALVEFALIFPIIMLLLAGVADIGGLLDVHNAGIYAARQGARTGAVIGTGIPPNCTSCTGCTGCDPTAADCAIVGAVHSALANQPNMTPNEITIYKAGSTGLYNGYADFYVGTADCRGNPGVIVDSANCPPGSVPGSVTCPQISALPGSNWPPTGTSPPRRTTPYIEDSLGVKIDYSYQFQFNIVGSGPFPASDYAVYPMNPAIG